MTTFRSNCPLSRTLDMLGDKWTLLVLRDIVAFHKTTFKELVQMPERIATNILADRLSRLVTQAFITRTQSSRHKGVYHYEPTKKALDLMPAVMMIAQWSESYLFEAHEMPTPAVPR